MELSYSLQFMKWCLVVWEWEDVLLCPREGCWGTKDQAPRFQSEDLGSLLTGMCSQETGQPVPCQEVSACRHGPHNSGDPAFHRRTPYTSPRHSHHSQQTCRRMLGEGSVLIATRAGAQLYDRHVPLRRGSRESAKGSIRRAVWAALSLTATEEQKQEKEQGIWGHGPDTPVNMAVKSSRDHQGAH
ncbi:Fucose-1-Phosphate Guanylyltransferase [Manis pentadactyla]|nr:Fucose-1-Phosphate Guanylyltransferase [Manis pentadactyla]